MRSWICAVNAFGSVVMIVVVSIVSPSGDFQLSQRPAKLNGSPVLSRIHQGCFGVSPCHS